MGGPRCQVGYMISKILSWVCLLFLWHFLTSRLQPDIIQAFGRDNVSVDEGGQRRGDIWTVRDEQGRWRVWEWRGSAPDGSTGHGEELRQRQLQVHILYIYYTLSGPYVYFNTLYLILFYFRLYTLTAGQFRRRWSSRYGAGTAVPSWGTPATTRRRRPGGSGGAFVTRRQQCLNLRVKEVEGTGTSRMNDW